MNRQTCMEKKGWHLGLRTEGIKNICSNCDDKDTCNQPFKMVWNEGKKEPKPRQRFPV